jgi:type II secretion system protein N
MKERLLALRPILLRVIGYPLFFLFFFVVFLYATFPWDRLREAIVAAAEAPRVSPGGRATPSNLELAIGSLSPTFLPGVEARDVNVTFLPTRPGDRPASLSIDKLRVRVSIFALLAQRASLSFSMLGMGGSIEGDASIALGPPATPRISPLRAFDLTFDHVRLGQMAPLVAMVGLPLGGNLSGTVAVTIPEGDVAQTEGTVRLTTERLTVGDGRAQFQIPHFGGVTIEQIRAGSLEATADIRRGVVQFTRVGAHSEEFDLQIDGRIDLRPNFADSAMNMGLRFRLTDVYRAKSEQAGRIMSVMDMAPDLRRARRADGLFAFRCTGTFERSISCPPDTRAAGTPGAAMPVGFAP